MSVRNWSYGAAAATDTVPSDATVQCEPHQCCDRSSRRGARSPVRTHLRACSCARYRSVRWLAGVVVMTLIAPSWQSLAYASAILRQRRPYRAIPKCRFTRAFAVVKSGELTLILAFSPQGRRDLKGWRGSRLRGNDGGLRLRAVTLILTFSPQGRRDLKGCEVPACAGTTKPLY